MDFRRSQRRWDAAVPVFPEKAASVPSGLRKALTARLVANNDGHPSGKRGLEGQARVTALSTGNIHKHGELFVDFLKARKLAFIDGRGWNLPQTDGMEFDQYDTPQSRWIALHEYGEVLAGVRLTPSTAECGIYSYMIRDAQRGLLEHIPEDLLFFKAPVHEKIWEASRIFVANGVPSDRRVVMHAMLFDTMVHTLHDAGATHVLGLVPSIWSRWVRRLSYKACPAGRRMKIAGENYQVALMNVRKNMG